MLHEFVVYYEVFFVFLLGTAPSSDQEGAFTIETVKESWAGMSMSYSATNISSLSGNEYRGVFGRQCLRYS